ncbi:MAG: DUF4340 domain-containing protein [Saprospiraceae bacterium]
MKNKHLVLLFLSVLASGLAARWLPLRYRTFFDSHLLRFDPEAVSRMVVSVPGSPDLFLERIENGWGAEQNGRAAVAPADSVHVLLSALAGVRTFRLIKTDRPDTLGFLPENILHIRLFQGKKLVERIEIGMEQAVPNEDVSTYLRLPVHGGVYLVNGQLRRLFRRSLDDFRGTTIFPFAPSTVVRIEVSGPGTDLVLLPKNAPPGLWSDANGSVSVPDSAVLIWLRQVQRLNNLPFADDFDESRDAETQFAAFVLESGGQSLLVRFFRVQPPDLPENPERIRNGHPPSEYVVQSSANPLNYFAISDTNLIRVLCQGPVSPIRLNDR